MKKAVELPRYSDANEFTPPDGDEIVSLDQATFLDGTAPSATCDHPQDQRNLFQKLFGVGKSRN